MFYELSEYQKHLVLFVDDEEKTRKYFKRLFGDTFNILLASDGVEALKVLMENLDQIGLIVTDQRMPNETGVAFLEKAAKLKPSAVRILSTAFADIDAAIDSVNKGGVYRYITKPWDVADLELTLRRAMEYFLLHAERDELLQQKILGVQSMALSDRVISLAALAASRELNLRYVNDALVAAMQLHSSAQARAGAPISGPTGGSWRDYYKQHHAFLSKCIAGLAGDLASGSRLTADQRTAAGPVLAAVATGAGYEIEPAAGSLTIPGPSARAQEILGVLLGGLKATLAGGEKIHVKETAAGIELLLPAASIGSALDPLFGNGTKSPDERSFGIVSAVLSFCHQGGTVDVLALADGGLVKARINFAEAHLAEANSTAIEDLAADLIGNELFWSRNGG